ncbi:chalcone isomerase family protein [Alcanivorax sp. 1008]|uniref:chalcone isomerase family protein n=1 Tax=Alcanivorax sp. 1008 TaxID=2816853 RepID=UPI001D72B697|nr:chalcone isomerase family protein [Alcanivorax sp. 1008]MCC1495462.1 chalcone isomerase family protein [Alcanivorax sp. 1008]
MRSLLLSAVLVLFCGHVGASSQHPSTLDTGIRLDQCGSAPVQALRFIEVGVASLWRDGCGQQTRSLTPPLLLEFTYQREVPGSAFSRSATAMIERNVGAATFANLQQRVEAFNSHYRDIGDGDSYQLRYLSDGRLELLLNNELLVSEQGHEFANAYLQIWFGPKPYSERLKEQLLALRP